MLRILLLAILLVACADPLAPSQPKANSVVALLELAPPPDCLGFPEEPCRFAYTYKPTCAAFAIKRRGQTMLATAAHCVPDEATSQTPLRFWAPSGFGHGKAHLLERNEARDIAFLTLDEPDMVTSLRIGRSPTVGESVWSYSPIYRERSAGAVLDWLNRDFYESTQTVDDGWSGSPVLDEQGRAIGIVIQCPTIFRGAEPACGRGRATVAAAHCLGER